MSPYGTRFITWEGDTPTIRQTLSPQEQHLQEQRWHTSATLGDVGIQGAHSLSGIIGRPVDFSGAPAAPSSYTPDARLTPSASPEVLDSGTLPVMSQALDMRRLPNMPNAYQGPGDLPDMPAESEAIRTQVIDAMMGRADQDIGKRQEQVQSDLIARGLRPGTEAYAREMDTLGRQRNDAMQQAQIAGGDAAAQAFGMDLSRRQQGQNEALANAGLSYNQGMGIRSQVTGEQAQSFGQGMDVRSQAMGEQGQRFGQTLTAGNQNFQQRGQAAQLSQSQQAQQYAQQESARQRRIGEMLTQRQVPLNEIIGLMGSTQVANPMAPGAGGGAPGGYNPSTVAPPPIFGAHQAQNQYEVDVYNSQATNARNQQSAAAAVGAALITAY